MRSNEIQPTVTWCHNLFVAKAYARRTARSVGLSGSNNDCAGMRAQAEHDLAKSAIVYAGLTDRRRCELFTRVAGLAKYVANGALREKRLRTAFLDAKTVGDKARADNMMTGALKSLFAVAENYPDLKADRSFGQFQGRISEIEDHIADRREFYNDSVNTFNIRIEQIPHVFVARMLGYTARELFKAAESDRDDVQISFD